MLTALRSAHARTSPTDREGGFTLIELMVAMVLTTALGAMALIWFVGANSSTRTSTDSNIASANARNVLQSWAKLITVAHAPASDPTGSPTAELVSLSPTSITFNANIGSFGALPSCPTTGPCQVGTPSTVTLAIGANSGTGHGQLTQTVKSATTVILPGDPASVSAGACLFTAYDATGKSLGCGTATTPLNAAALVSVARVDIAFTVTTDGRARSYQTSASVIGGQNAGVVQ